MSEMKGLMGECGVLKQGLGYGVAGAGVVSASDATSRLTAGQGDLEVRAYAGTKVEASTPFVLPTARAAEWLAEHAPIRSAEQWSAWLRHNNRSGRHVRYRMRSQRIGNLLLFSMEELAKVRKFEMERAARNGYSKESLDFLTERREEVR